MEHTVNNPRLSLEKRLRSELGNKMTPWMLQETLLGGNPQETSAPSPTMRGRSGMRLSERFKQYYQLVASSSSQSDQSLAVLASDIYLDMEETSELIARTREEITRATLIEQLNQSFGANYAGDDGNRRWREIDFVRRRNQPNADRGAASGQLRAGLSQPAGKLTHLFQEFES